MSHEEQLRLVEGLHARESGLLERTSLFDLLAPEVEWLVAGSPEFLPWAGVFRGPDGVTQWMQTLDEHLEYDRFEAVEFFADGDTVIEIVLAGGRARATGSAFESEVVRIWTFRGNEAIRVRSFYDTGAYERAVLGS
ncbi:MAG TPA: nuclear transport factor 2 family protein [Gaiellaceae bacterium]|nr:nuclear transport factor 2 family protein [Gaiellaceae bacterium]